LHSTEPDPSTPDDRVTPATIPAQTALSAIRAQMPDLLVRAERAVRTGTLPLLGWGRRQPRVRLLDRTLERDPWYIVGDIHGDFLAWHRLLSRVEEDALFRLCFLGDLVDRGPYSIECFAALLDAAFRHPGEILWIAGNHDTAIRAVSRPTPDGPAFESAVHPAEFVDWLNATDIASEDESEREVRMAWGRLFVSICERLPRALLFPSGLLATHGGIPLPDRWDDLLSLEALEDPRVLEDFTWTRAATVPKRVGFRHDLARRARSSDFEYGWKDFEEFCQVISRIEGVPPVSRIVRGHDHVAAGWEQPHQYPGSSLLTTNGFGFHHLTNSTQNYRATLTMGRVADARTADIVRVEVEYAPEEHQALYPPPMTVPDVSAPPVEPC
jgi:hypothetical protein